MSTPGRNLLITGVSGFLGRHLCRAACDAWRVTGSFLEHECEIPGVALRRADLGERNAVRRLLDATAPAAVIHAAGATRLDACEQKPAESRRANVDATRWLAEECVRRGVGLVYVSTDQVFDGEHAPYDEAAPPSPVNEYGRQKAAAEAVVRDLCGARGLVCRLPLLFGRADPGAANFLATHVKALRARQTLRLFTDEFRTPVSATVAAEGILLTLVRGGRGVFHLGGLERVSRWQLGMLVAEVAGLAAAPIVAARRSEGALSAPRPADVSLVSARASTLGFRPPPLREQLAAALSGL